MNMNKQEETILLVAAIIFGRLPDEEIADDNPMWKRRREFAIEQALRLMDEVKSVELDD